MMTSRPIESSGIQRPNNLVVIQADIKGKNHGLSNPNLASGKRLQITGAVHDVEIDRLVREYIYVFENSLKERDSLNRTIAGIISHPWVKSILETEKFDYDDMKGRDLIVELYNSRKRHIPGETVFVQVKSSWTGVREFIKSKSVKRRVDWTVFREEEKMVLINGQFDAKLIRDSFDAQLHRLCVYYA